jgi:hypothetical protein
MEKLPNASFTGKVVSRSSAEDGATAPTPGRDSSDARGQPTGAAREAPEAEPRGVGEPETDNRSSNAGSMPIGREPHASNRAEVQKRLLGSQFFQPAHRSLVRFVIARARALSLSETQPLIRSAPTFVIEIHRETPEAIECELVIV